MPILVLLSRVLLELKRNTSYNIKITRKIINQQEPFRNTNPAGGFLNAAQGNLIHGKRNIDETRIHHEMLKPKVTNRRYINEKFRGVLDQASSANKWTQTSFGKRTGMYLLGVIRPPIGQGIDDDGGGRRRQQRRAERLPLPCARGNDRALHASSLNRSYRHQLDRVGSDRHGPGPLKPSLRV